MWQTKIELPTEETREMLKFRYFIGFYLQAANDPSPKIRVISRWESQRAARALLPSVEADSNAVCRLKHVDEFGVYGWFLKLCLSSIVDFMCFLESTCFYNTVNALIDGSLSINFKIHYTN